MQHTTSFQRYKWLQPQCNTGKGTVTYFHLIGDIRRIVTRYWKGCIIYEVCVFLVMEYAKNQPFFKQTQSNLRCVSNQLILLKHLQEMPGPFWLLVNMVWTFVKPLRDGAVPEGPFERGGETGGKIQVKSLTQSHICRLLLISREVFKISLFSVHRHSLCCNKKMNGKILR